jgi:hypothetical protein
MHVLLMILLSLVLLYLLGLATAFLLSLFLIRQKLREYQENGRFGY